MKEHTNIDDLIRESLSQEEAKFYDELDEYSIIESFGSLYKGKNKWFTIFVTMVTFLFVGLMVYFGYGFFNAATTPEMLKWGAGMFACFATVSMLKIFNWMQMDKNVLLREIKRLELQVSLLAKKLEEK